MYPFQPFTWANLFYPFIHLSEPKRDVYHSSQDITAKTDHPGHGSQGEDAEMRAGRHGFMCCDKEAQSPLRLSPWPHLKADQAPFPLLGCPSTHGDQLSGQMSGIPRNHSWKISSHDTDVLSSSSLPSFSLFFFFICFPFFLFYSLLCRPPIMVINLAIIFLIFISCSLVPGWQREWLSFSNVSHFLTHPTDMFTDGTHHYWKYFVYLFIFYCLFPQTKI